HKSSGEKLITEALLIAKPCNFIIFLSKDKKLFVQYWLGNGRIECSWPVMKKNELGKYTYQMLGVLNELGISRDFNRDNMPVRKKSNTYTFVRTKRMLDYQINFGKDIKTVTL